MTEHKHPEAFPEHVRPYLLPLPETQWEALFLLRCFADSELKRTSIRHLHPSEKVRRSGEM